MTLLQKTLLGKEIARYGAKTFDKTVYLAVKRFKTTFLQWGQYIFSIFAVEHSMNSQADQERVRAESRVKGVSAALGLLDSLKQAAQARLEASWRAMEEKLKTPYRKPANNQPPTDAVIISPLTAEQHTALANWNIAAQVGAYMLTAGIGVAIGAIVGVKIGGPAGGFAGTVIGAMLGAGWGAYEALCIASVQDEFDEAYQRGSSITVWREGWRFNVYASGGDMTYVEANAPLSMLYVAVTTYLLSGKLP